MRATGDRRARSTAGAACAAAVVATLAVAAWLRFHRLGSGLWYDEVVTLVEFVRLPLASLLTTYTSPNNHPLYSLAAKASIAVFGESAWALRLPAALFGVASVAAVGSLARRLVSPREAFWAMVLVAVSYHHIWFSQNARGYTGLLLGALVETELFLLGMRASRRRLWLVYAVVGALTLYVHLSAAFLFAAHGLVYALAHLRERLRGSSPEATSQGGLAGAAELWPLAGLAGAAALAVLLYAPLLPQVVAALTAQASAAGHPAAGGVTAWRSPWWTAQEILRGLRLGYAGLGGVAAVGLLSSLGALDRIRRDPVAVAAMLLPGALTLAGVVLLSYHVWPRYFFASLGFAAIFVVRGAFLLGEGLAQVAFRARPEAGAVAGSLAAAALALASAFSLPRLYAVPKQDYAGARRVVEALREPGDQVVSVGLASLPLRELYAPQWGTVADAKGLRAARARARRLWVVFSFPTQLRATHPEIMELLEHEFERVAVVPGTLGDGDLYVWRSRPLQASTKGETDATPEGRGGRAAAAAGAGVP